MSTLGQIDSDGIFRHACDVRFHDTERTMRLTPFALYGHLQESAMRHSTAAGLTGDALRNRGWAWVQNRVHLQVDRYPAWGESLVVETWASSFKGMFAQREFVLRDSDGKAVVCGTSRWVLVDLNKLKPMRMPPELTDEYRTNEQRALDDSFPRMHAPETVESSRSFHVRLSDLDTNQHANSACYIDWCLESATHDVHSTCAPTRFEITYKKESVLGDAIRSDGAPATTSEPGARVFDHAVYNDATGELLALGRSYWTPDAATESATPTGLTR